MNDLNSVPRPSPKRPYSDKLNDARWLRLKHQILERDRYRCLYCDLPSGDLLVRHIVHNRCEPWEYEPEMYVTVCPACNHDRQPILDRLLNAIRSAVKNVPTDQLECRCRLIATFARKGK